MSVAQSSSPDPTRTVTFRRDWTSSYNARWRDIRGRLRDQLTGSTGLLATTTTDAATLQEFRQWFNSVIEEKILQPTDPRRVRQGQHYTASRIRDAYERGLRRADQSLRAAPSDYSTALDSLAAPAAAIRASRHQEELVNAYVRAYQDVQEAAQKTRQDVRRNLNEKLEADAAKQDTVDTLTTRVDKTGQTATQRFVAATTIITVNKAALNRYRAAGVEKVGAEIEQDLSVEGPMTDNPELARGGVPGSDEEVRWGTAGDNRVCPQCMSLEGQTWKIAEYNNGGGKMPVIDTHLNCRCFIAAV